MKDFSIEKLTLGEIAQLEELTGLSLSAMSDDAAPKGKFLAGLAWLAKRRQDPTFSYEQAQAMSMEEFGDLLGNLNAPKAVSAKPARKTSHSS